MSKVVENILTSGFLCLRVNACTILVFSFASTCTETGIENSYPVTAARLSPIFTEFLSHDMDSDSQRTGTESGSRACRAQGEILGLGDCGGFLQSP